MITLIQARRYRCLKYVSQSLDSFHVLVGPNASGKTTFLDVVSFLGDFVSEGLETALHNRSLNFMDLVWNRREPLRFELAIEARTPEEFKIQLPRRFNTVRYEIALAVDRTTQETVIEAERGMLMRRELEAFKESLNLQPEASHFPSEATELSTILTGLKQRGFKTVFNKLQGGNDNYYSEVSTASGRRWASFKLGARKSTLGNLPEDESKFPASSWLKNLLTDGVQSFVLNSAAIRRPSPPGQKRTFKTDGSNLPWVVEHLKEQSPSEFEDWIAHLQTALDDLESIRTVERPEDRHRYLMLRYRGGLEVPSWMTSDGTLRLLALTLPAFLQDFKGIYLIEEPENGIHPTAVDTMYRALSSVYQAQILLATHSPVILAEADPKVVLCFAKTGEGATDIVRGDLHPRLRDWQGETNLGSLFAAGVLG